MTMIKTPTSMTPGGARSRDRGVRRPVGATVALIGLSFGLGGCFGTQSTVGHVSGPRPAIPLGPDPAPDRNVAGMDEPAGADRRAGQGLAPEASPSTVASRAGDRELRFNDPQRWPLDPVETAGNRQPDNRDGDLASVIPSLYGEIYSGAPLDRDRSDGEAVVAQVTAEEIGRTIAPSVSPDGDWVVYASNRHGRVQSIYIQRAEGRTATRVTDEFSDDDTPVFSPDGSEIAYASRRDGTFDIFVVPTTGGAATQITETPDDAMHPSFSPDGRRIAYCRLSTTSGRWEIWMTDRDTGRETFLAYGRFPEWNPDPARPSIVFQRARGRGQRFFSVWMIDIVDGETRAATEIIAASNGACMHPTWDPGGTRVAFVSVTEEELARTGEPIESEIWIVDADGRNRVQLTLGGSFNMQPDWSIDGSVYFVSDRNGWMNVWSIRDAATIAPGGRTGPEDRLTNAAPAAGPDGGGGS